MSEELNKLVDTLPSWVNFSEVEQVVWINSVMKILWPFAKAPTEEMIIDMLNPLLEMIKPKALSQLKLTKCDLGNKPILVTGVNCVRDINTAVVLDLSITLISETNVVLDVTAAGVTIPVRLANLKFMGKLTYFNLNPIVVRI